jgi:hypothetical protein
MVTRLSLATLCAALLVSAACERGPQTATEEPAAPDDATAAEVAPIAGMYEVAGTTVETTTGIEREISGSVILADDGESYTATYHLDTVFEGTDGVLPTEVIGKGSGAIEGRTLRGSAETQLVISSVPGIDPGFAFIPRTTTTRLVSTSVTTIAADGSVVIEIENSPALGEIYAPTRTTLRGTRIGEAGIAEAGEPDVAATPPEAD